MKLKRSIRMLMCYLVVVGTLAFNVLTVEASLYTHPYFEIAMDVEKDRYFDADYHILLCGTQHRCSCGYEY